MYINGSCAVAAAKKVAPLIASKKVSQIFAVVLVHCLTFVLDGEQYYKVEPSARSAKYRPSHVKYP